MKYKEVLEKIPEVAREVIIEEDVPTKLRNLAKEYKIHFDKWIPLEDEVMLTLLGEKDPENLLENVRAVTNLDPVSAAAFIEDLSEKIFKPIREKLKAAIEDGGKKRAIEVLKQSISAKASYKDYPNSAKRPFAPDDPYREPIE